MTFMNGDLNITPGLRYENVHTDFHDNSSSDSNDDKIKNMSSFLPGLSLGYQAAPNVFLFANTQRSLKAPQVASVRADGDLSVELAWNYEIGMRLDVNDMFSIQDSSAARMFERAKYNYPRSDKDYYKLILKNSVPTQIKNSNLQHFIRFNLTDLLPSCSYSFHKGVGKKKHKEYIRIEDGTDSDFIILINIV